jgi:hypothetical protein
LDKYLRNDAARNAASNLLSFPTTLDMPKVAVLMNGMIVGAMEEAFVPGSQQSSEAAAAVPDRKPTPTSSDDSNMESSSSSSGGSWDSSAGSMHDNEQQQFVPRMLNQKSQKNSNAGTPKLDVKRLQAAHAKLDDPVSGWPTAFASVDMSKIWGRVPETFLATSHAYNRSVTCVTCVSSRRRPQCPCTYMLLLGKHQHSAAPAKQHCVSVKPDRPDACKVFL